ncbi:hypothetical protein [Thioalkalivibrio sp. K90mix]|uniref:hypothetical protein n=1 Tax=Thioalkalivibrio sp. (strain K90mix) TaxID=396595 RepID=UPI0011D15E6B|nr:hypothetical protein [Thioalkalivibrio sp. K90mix]
MTALLAAPVAVALMAWSEVATGAASGSTVYDPVHHSETIASVLQDAQHYQQELERFYRQFENLANPEAMVGDTGVQLGQLESYVQEVERFAGSLGNAREFMDDVHRDFSVSPYEDWETYNEARTDQADRNVGRARQQYGRAAEITQDLESQYQQIQQHEANVPAIQGEVQGFQSLSSQMALMTRQNAQLIEISNQAMEAEGEQRTIEEAELEAERTEARAQSEAARQHNQETRDRAQSHFEAMGIR